MDIPGTGQFLIALNKEKSPRVFPPPDRDTRDLTLYPFEEVAIEETWLKSPLLVGQVQQGNVALRYDDLIPPRGRHDLAPEFEKTLTANEKQFVYAITRLDLTDQVKANIRLADLVRSGAPAQGVKVNREYLKNRHRTTLRAALELESRHQNRKEIKTELTKAIRKIEAMA